MRFNSLPFLRRNFPRRAAVSCLTFRRSREKQTPVAPRAARPQPPLTPMWQKGTENKNEGGKKNNTTRNASRKIIHHLDCLWEREENRACGAHKERRKQQKKKKKEKKKRNGKKRKLYGIGFSFRCGRDNDHRRPRGARTVTRAHKSSDTRARKTLNAASSAKKHGGPCAYRHQTHRHTRAGASAQHSYVCRRNIKYMHVYV